MKYQLAAPACLMCVAACALGNWPMAGHDPQRTSWVAEDEMPPATRPSFARQGRQGPLPQGRTGKFELVK